MWSRRRILSEVPRGVALWRGKTAQDLRIHCRFFLTVNKSIMLKRVRTGLEINHAYPVDATYSALAQSVASFISKVARCPIRAKLAVAVCRRFRERCWNFSDSFPTRGPALPILRPSDGRAVLSAITATGVANPGVQRGQRRCFDVRHAVVTPRSRPGRSCTGRRHPCRCGSGVPTW